jgi:hypothetical protein
MPIITFNKMFDQNKHFKAIFLVLSDQRLHVRTTAADCINEFIRMISVRDQ